MDNEVTKLDAVEQLESGSRAVPVEVTPVESVIADAPEAGPSDPVLSVIPSVREMQLKAIKEAYSAPGNYSAISLSNPANVSRIHNSTRPNKEESKVKRKMAEKSRKINRRK
jgi:hypothetical protein